MNFRRAKQLCAAGQEHPTLWKDAIKPQPKRGGFFLVVLVVWVVWRAIGLLAQDFPDVAPLGLNNNSAMHIDFDRGDVDDLSMFPVQVRLSTNINTSTLDVWTNYITVGANGSFVVVYSNVLTYGAITVTTNGGLLSYTGYTNNFTSGSTNSAVFYTYTTNNGSSLTVVGAVYPVVDPLVGGYVHGGAYSNDNMRFRGASFPVRQSQNKTIAFWARITGDVPTNNSGIYPHMLRSLDNGSITFSFLYDSRAASTGWTAVVYNPVWTYGAAGQETAKNIGQLSTNRWYRIGVIWEAATSNLVVTVNGRPPTYGTAGTNYHDLWHPTESTYAFVPFVGDLSKIVVWPRAFATNEYGSLSR